MSPVATKTHQVSASSMGASREAVVPEGPRLTKTGQVATAFAGQKPVAECKVWDASHLDLPLRKPETSMPWHQIPAACAAGSHGCIADDDIRASVSCATLGHALDDFGFRYSSESLCTANNIQTV